MESALYRSNLIVKKSPVHGYGVFAGADFEKGDVIEECYAVLLEGDDYISNYVFANPEALLRKSLN